MTKPKIGILGLGIMGNGIATNYLQSGYEVNVWNRTKEKCADAQSLGANVFEFPNELCLYSNIIFDVTASDESSKYVFFDNENGLLNVALENQIFITCATLSIDYVDELTKACNEKGLTFFDMPMTGSRVGAESGNLTLLVGGDKNKLDELNPHLDPIAGDVRYFGCAGSGMKFKLVLNAIQAAHVIALGDAMRQSKAIGIDLLEAGDFFQEKPGGYPTQMAKKSFFDPPVETQFSVKWILKDLKYAKQMLNRFNYLSPVDTSILDVSISVLQKAYDDGLGDQDWTIVNQ